MGISFKKLCGCGESESLFSETLWMRGEWESLLRNSVDAGRVRVSFQKLCGCGESGSRINSQRRTQHVQRLAVEHVALDVGCSFFYCDLEQGRYSMQSAIITSSVMYCF